MVSVVVMAGYKPSEIEDYKRQLKYYHEKYTEKGYKALKEFKVREGGHVVRRPLIEFILRKLDDIYDVKDVVIVGDKERLEAKLADKLASCKKKYTIVDQNEPLSPRLIEEFKLNPVQVPHNSLAGNGIKAYAATEAFSNKAHALFVAADSPKTHKRTIEDFITASAPLSREAAVVYPLVSMEELPRWRKCFHRKYLFLINDTPYKFNNTFTTWFTKREGFRPSSMLFANPYRLNVNMVNTFYGLRKMVSNEVRIRVKQILKDYGHDDFRKKYLVTKDCTITDGERVVSSLMGGKLTVLPIRDVDSTYDYDGTQTEEDAITRILQEE